RGDPDQEHLPDEMPEPLRLPDRVVARRPGGRLVDGCAPWLLVCRLLLGPDGLTLCARCDEHHLDGSRERTDRRREDAPLAAAGGLRDGVRPRRPRPDALPRAGRSPGADDPRERWHDGHGSLTSVTELTSSPPR